MKKLLPLFLWACVALGIHEAGARTLQVAALHPLLADMAVAVGGGNVEVINIMKRGADPHHFSPSPSDLERIAASDVVLAMGKNLEPYLPKLRDNLRPNQTLLEVGRTIPSLRIKDEDELFLCSPASSVGAIDPHWWHSIENMRRASRVVAAEFSKVDPAHSENYNSGARAYSRKLDNLENWAKTQIAPIPRQYRILATAHLAFGYFCKEFGFRAIGIQGLTTEQEPTAQHLATAIETIRLEGVKALFPDRGANPKILARIARDAGVRIGGPLDAYGNASGDPVTYEAVVRHNVGTIVEALK